MDKPLNILYDHAADVLHVSTGHPVLSDAAPLNDEIILQLDPLTKEIVGFSIVDFTKNFANRETPISIPIMATFKRISKAKNKRAASSNHRRN